MLFEAVRAQEAEAVEQWATNPHWQTLRMLMSASGSSEGSGQAGGGAGAGRGSRGAATGGGSSASSTSMWSCQHCTFINQSSTSVCAVCSLPRS